MPYRHQTSGTHLHSNRTLASVIQRPKFLQSTSTTKNFVTKPEKSLRLAANPHRISKRLHENPGSILSTLGFGGPILRFGGPKIQPTNPTEPDPGVTFPSPLSRQIFSTLAAPAHGAWACNIYSHFRE